MMRPVLFFFDNELFYLRNRGHDGLRNAGEVMFGKMGRQFCMSPKLLPTEVASEADSVKMVLSFDVRVGFLAPGGMGSFHRILLRPVRGSVGEFDTEAVAKFGHFNSGERLMIICENYCRDTEAGDEFPGEGVGHVRGRGGGHREHLDPPAEEVLQGEEVGAASNGWS